MSDGPNVLRVAFLPDPDEADGCGAAFTLQWPAPKRGGPPLIPGVETEQTLDCPDCGYEHRFIADH